MANTSDSTVSSCCKMGLKPLTTENILFYYLPIQGVVSYSALAVNVMNPSLVIKVFPKRDVTNILLCNTLLGTSLYLYNSPHLKSLPKKDKVVYGAFGAVTFSLGSVLIWAIIRNVVPQNIFLCTAAGVGSGLALMKIARSYVRHVDALAKPAK